MGIAGGSATSRPCSKKVGGFFEMAVRHLQQAFPIHAKNLFANNAGQGSTNSLWNSMMIDSLLDTYGLDVIFWEYAINDAHMNNNEKMMHYLDIWLNRVSQLPSQPAVVLVYLWDSTRPDDALRPNATERFPASSALIAQFPVVEYYRSKGMDISVLNIAAGIVKDPLSILFDDHHPNCMGMHYVGDVIASYLLRQASQALRNSNTDAKCKLWPEDKAIEPYHRERRDRAVETMLSSPVVFSTHEFLPQMGRRPRIVWTKKPLARMHGTKSVQSREGKQHSPSIPIFPTLFFVDDVLILPCSLFPDVKSVFPVPDCKNSPLVVKVYEKNVRAVTASMSWVVGGLGGAMYGMSESRRCTRHSVSYGIVDIRINGRRPQFPGSDMTEIASIDTPGYFPLWSWSSSDVRDISICYNTPNHTTADGNYTDAMEILTADEVVTCAKPQLVWYILFASK